MKRKAETHYLLLGHFNNNSTWRWRNICCLTYILSVNKAKAISVGRYVLIIYVYVYIFIHIFLFGWLLVLRRMNCQCASSQCTFSWHANHAIRYWNTLSIWRLVPQWVSFFSPSLSPTWTAIQITGCPPFYFTNGVAGVTSRCSWTIFACNAAGAELKNLQQDKSRIMQSHVRWCFQTYILEFRIGMFCLPECLFPSAAPNPVLFPSMPYHILHRPPDCKTTNRLSEREKPSLGWIGFSCTWLTFSADLRHQTKP